MLSLNELDKVLVTYCMQYIGECNSPNMRKMVVDELKNIIRTLIISGVVSDALNANVVQVFCNEENNPPSIIDENKLVADLYVKGHFSSLPNGYRRHILVSKEGTTCDSW